MSLNQFPTVFNWQSANPATGFLPTPYQTGSLPSGVPTGTMSGTNTIYSNIIDVSKMLCIGIDVSWTGNPTGTIQVLSSNGGVNFSPLTFNPVLAQPAGSPSFYGINISNFGFKYIMLNYINASGAGVLTTIGQFKERG